MVITEEWFHNGYRHRLKGPGYIDKDLKEYWIYGKNYRDKQKWEIEVNRLLMLEEL